MNNCSENINCSAIKLPSTPQAKILPLQSVHLNSVLIPQWPHYPHLLTRECLNNILMTP